jgi:hypothetical protein
MLNAEDGRLASSFGHQAIRNFITSPVPHEGVSLARVWSIATLECWLKHHPASMPDIAEMRAAGLQHNSRLPRSIDHISYGVSELPDMSIEAASAYAADNGLGSFAIDGPLAGEYRAEHAAGSNSFHATRHGVETRLVAGRSRIKAPFQPLGHFICTDPQNALGVFWCLDLLKSGYCFVHIPKPGGVRKVLLIEQLARNCLSRISRGGD